MEYRIKKYREDLNMSQVDLAKKSNVSRTIISGLESGSISVTTTETLSKIANALGRRVSDIFLDWMSNKLDCLGDRATKRYFW